MATDSERLAKYRAAGWVVAVHNDYRAFDKPHTFWLLTKDAAPSDRWGVYVSGEGRTDAEAFTMIDAVMADLTTMQAKG